MNDPVTGQIWWIIGASEGLGRALAEKLHRQGARLILSARNEARLAELAAALPGARVLPCDVTDPDSCRQAAAEAGAVAGLIYCAGAYQPMTAQTWDPEGAALMAETNLTGALRLLGHAVPAMIARGTGRILLIGSLVGYRGLPGAIGYGASKAGLMSLGESLRADLRGTGVRVQIANPGFIRTRLTAQNRFIMPQIMSPEAAADHVIAALRSERFSTAFPSPFAWLFQLGRHLPIALFHALFPRDLDKRG